MSSNVTAIFSRQLAVLPLPEGREWSSIPWSSAPYALCVLPPDGHVEDYTDTAVWGLDRNMSVEDAWRDFEHASRYVVVDDTPTGEILERVMVTDDRSAGGSGATFRGVEDLVRYLRRYADDGTYVIRGDIVYVTPSAMRAAERGFRSEEPIRNVIDSACEILAQALNLSQICDRLQPGVRDELLTRLASITHEGNKILEDGHRALRLMPKNISVFPSDL
ncbi:MAG: hypothetical protein N3G75_06715 [Methanothrix sp.]|nr:hypothetical protein [Methanothrix sp.]MCX8207508.1 hypothetical protein [Methanothrix sp.]